MQKIKILWQKILLLARNNFLLFFVILLIVALIIAGILQVLTPQEERLIESDFVIKNYDQTESTFKQVNYDGPDYLVAERLFIYRPKNTENTADLLAELIRKNFQLSQNPNNKNHWFSDDKSLIKRVAENKFVLYDYQVKEGQKFGIDLEQGIQTCAQFFQGASQISLLANKEKVKYLGAGLEPQEVEARKAKFIFIPFSQKIEGYPLYFQNDQDSPFSCLLNSDYQISQVTFQDFFYDFQQSNSIKSISVDQAIKNISKGKASIIDAKSQIASILDLNWIKTAELHTVLLVYRYDSQLEAAYPFYQFSGVITNSDGVNIQAEIITPAILSEREN